MLLLSAVLTRLTNNLNRVLEVLEVCLGGNAYHELHFLCNFEIAVDNRIHSYTHVQKASLCSPPWATFELHTLNKSVLVLYLDIVTSTFPQILLGGQAPSIWTILEESLTRKPLLVSGGKDTYLLLVWLATDLIILTMRSASMLTL